MDLYKPGKVYDELITKAGRSRRGATRLVRWLKKRALSLSGSIVKWHRSRYEKWV